MALPKHKTPKAKQRKRRSHHHIGAPNLVLCPQCRQMHVNHTLCAACGTYNGHSVYGDPDAAGQPAGAATDAADEDDD